MAKIANTLDNTGHRSHRWARVNMPPDAALSELLHGSGTKKTAQLVHLLSIASDPLHADRHVDLPVDLAPAVTEDLARILAQAREAGNPAADELAGVLEQLGYREGGPEPEHAGY
jgi:hypothetical protein